MVATTRAWEPDLGGRSLRCVSQLYLCGLGQVVQAVYFSFLLGRLETMMGPSSLSCEDRTGCMHKEGT